MASQMDETELKAAVYEACTIMLKNKMEAVQQVLADLKYSAANETKSIAGDKHETALAMLQLEQENQRQQLQVLQQQQAVLNRIQTHLPPQQIGLGSLVKTNHAYFFIAVPLGKLILNQQLIFVISPESPLGKTFLGAVSGNSIPFHQTSYVIEAIF
jgi:hypothetical protein